MIQITPKAARILYSILASITIILFWRNIGFVTTLFDIPNNSILGLSIKALLLTLATLILTIVVIKPKELFSFLGLNGNILKDSVSHSYVYYPCILYFPFSAASIQS